MEWLEAEPLPIECQKCQEFDCYNCDYAGKRWYLSPEDDARIKHILSERALKRLITKNNGRLCKD